MDVAEIPDLNLAAELGLDGADRDPGSGFLAVLRERGLRAAKVTK
jgi:hypothetical protein